MDLSEGISGKVRLKYILLLLVFLLAACGQESLQEDEEENQVLQEVSFSNLNLEVEDVIFRLTGEVRTEENTIYYHVSQGEETILEEQSLEIESNGNWVEFEIAEELASETTEAEDSPILNLYGKTEKEEIINPNYIAIDIGIR